MKKMFTAFLMLCFVQAYTQRSDSLNKLKFHFIIQAGALTGEACSPPFPFQAQTISGLQLKSWFAGIGTGIDNYSIRSIPLFIDIRKNITNKSSSPFVFADAGINLPWLNNYQKNFNYIGSSFSKGFYYNLGAGYKIKMFKNDALLFSAAYSQKQLWQTGYQPPYISVLPPSGDLQRDMKYIFRRWSFQVGWMF